MFLTLPIKLFSKSNLGQLVLILKQLVLDVFKLFLHCLVFLPGFFQLLKALFGLREKKLINIIKSPKNLIFFRIFFGTQMFHKCLKTVSISLMWLLDYLLFQCI